MVEPYGWGISVSNTGENQLSAVNSPTHLIHFNGDRLRGPYESLCPH